MTSCSTDASPVGDDGMSAPAVEVWLPASRGWENGTRVDKRICIALQSDDRTCLVNGASASRSPSYERIAPTTRSRPGRPLVRVWCRHATRAARHEDDTMQRGVRRRERRISFRQAAHETLPCKNDSV